MVQPFKRNEDGDLVPASGPRQCADERSAVAHAQDLSRRYAGVVAWKVDTDPDEGDLGEPAMIFARGEVPDIDMPVRRIEVPGADAIGSASRDGNGSGEPTWMGMRLPTASAWQPFRNAFLELYENQHAPDVLAVFTSLENRRIVVLPPEAARLVQRELPAYPLRACGRPPSNMVCLEIGHRLQGDTTWFSLTDDECTSRKVAAGRDLQR